MKKLGKYHIQKKIGAGGMGAVYLALDTELNRTVALKILPKEKAENPILVKRFKAEGQAAAHLRHESIVTVYEAGEADGYLYIALEYVEGVDVHDLVNKRGPLPVKRSVEIMKQLARALEHAYEKNIVHRDIKPSNVLIKRDGTVKLTDLGLARSIDETTETGITRAGTTVGTVDYMAPEQARDSKASDARSDIYSLGCTWYHMLTESPPYPKGSLTNKLQAHANAPIPDPRDINSSIPEGVVAVMHRMMAKKKTDRYQTPAELLEDLQNANLNRTAVSNNVLAALAEDGESPKPRSADKNRDPHELPPKEIVRKKTEEKKPLDLTKFKYASIAVFAFCFLSLLIWISMGSGSASNGQNAGVGDNPFKVPKDPVAGQSGNGPLISSNRKNAAAGTQKNSGGSNGDHAGGGEKGNPGQPNADGTTTPNPGVSQQANMVTAGTLPKVIKSQNLISVQRAGIQTGENTNTRQKQIPDWAKRVVQSQSNPTISSVNSSTIRTPLPQWTIQSNSADSKESRTLEKILDELPETGGVIELVGRGPFVLSPTTIKKKREVIIRAGKSATPIIMLIADRNHSSKHFLELIDSSLTLIGLHLSFAAPRVPTSDSYSIFSVRGGDVSIQDCSITQLGTRPGSTVACAVSGTGIWADRSPKNQSHILIDNTFIRGEGLTALQIDQTAVEAVCHNSLFVSGTAPAIELLQSQQPLEKATDENRPADRRLSFFSTTVSSQTAAWKVSPAKGNVNVSTEISLFESVFTADNSKKKSAFLILGSWDVTGIDGPDWMSWQENSLQTSQFLGWNEVMRIEAAGSARSVSSGGGWETFWKLNDVSSQFKMIVWPKKKITNHAGVSPDHFNKTSLTDLTHGSNEAELPGCDVSQLQSIDGLLLSRFVGLAQRPIMPKLFESNDKPAVVIELDLSKKDLGKHLAETDWPDGTLVIATGQGVCLSSPIRVKNKSLTIQFHQNRSNPLFLSPKMPRRLVEKSTVAEDDAFITVEQGKIELKQVAVRMTDSSRLSVPTWFLKVIDGSFSIKNSSVRGPIVGNTRVRGLINWTKSNEASAPKKSPAIKTKSKRQVGIIFDSILSSTGFLIKADMPQRALFLNNNLLVALDDLLEIDLTSGQSNLDASVVMTHCTLSATKTFFRVLGRDMKGTAGSPLNFFVDESVFGQPVVAGSRTPTPTLLAADQLLIQQKQIEWWGGLNGHSNQIFTFLNSAENANPKRQSFDVSWLGVWGSAQTFRPAIGTAAVPFREKRIERSKLSPEKFELHTSATGRKWNGRSTPLGANITAITTGMLKTPAAGSVPQQSGKVKPNRFKKDF